MRPLKTSYRCAATLILSGLTLFAAPSVSTAGPPVVQSEVAEESSDALELLEQVRSISRDLARDAATLESYTLGRLSWQTHAYQLNSAKEHINAIGERLQSLQAIRHTAAPWQRQAIDAMIPVARELASRTEDAIRHLNDNHQRLLEPVYTNHLRTIAQNSEQIKQTTSLFLDYANTQERLNDLKERLTTTQQS
ncbi:MAG: hypothetical protein ACJ74Y_05185 [Bryobacteraceae bacterium]